MTGNLGDPETSKSLGDASKRESQEGSTRVSDAQVEGGAEVADAPEVSSAGSFHSDENAFHPFREKYPPTTSQTSSWDETSRLKNSARSSDDSHNSREGIADQNSLMAPAEAGPSVRKPIFRVKKVHAGYQPQEKRRPQFSSQNIVLSSLGTKFNFFIGPIAFRKITTHIQWGKRTFDNLKEQGGLLVGEAFYDSNDQQIWTIVHDAIPGHSARGDAAFLAMGHQTWKNMIEIFDHSMKEIERRNEPRHQIVGWYHTHPDTIPVFMSGTDRNTQTLFFGAEWQVAVVINPHKEKLGAFRGRDAVKEEWLIFDGDDLGNGYSTPGIPMRSDSQQTMDGEGSWGGPEGQKKSQKGAISPNANRQSSTDGRQGWLPSLPRIDIIAGFLVTLLLGAIGTGILLFDGWTGVISLLSYSPATKASYGSARHSSSDQWADTALKDSRSQNPDGWKKGVTTVDGSASSERSSSNPHVGAVAAGSVKSVTVPTVAQSDGSAALQKKALPQPLASNLPGTTRKSISLTELDQLCPPFGNDTEVNRCLDTVCPGHRLEQLNKMPVIICANKIMAGD